MNKVLRSQNEEWKKILAVKVETEKEKEEAEWDIVKV